MFYSLLSANKNYPGIYRSWTIKHSNTIVFNLLKINNMLSPVHIKNILYNLYVLSASTLSILVSQPIPATRCCRTSIYITADFIKVYIISLYKTKFFKR